MTTPEYIRAAADKALVLFDQGERTRAVERFLLEMDRHSETSYLYIHYGRYFHSLRPIADKGRQQFEAAMLAILSQPKPSYK